MYETIKQTYATVNEQVASMISANISVLDIVTTVIHTGLRIGIPVCIIMSTNICRNGVRVLIVVLDLLW